MVIYLRNQKSKLETIYIHRSFVLFFVSLMCRFELFLLLLRHSINKGIHRVLSQKVVIVNDTANEQICRQYQNSKWVLGISTAC